MVTVRMLPADQAMLSAVPEYAAVVYLVMFTIETHM